MLAAGFLRRVVLLAVLTAVSAPADAVIDGVPTGQWPVGIFADQSPQNNGYDCSAVAIAQDWVLTAAHCGQFVPYGVMFYWVVDYRSCGGFFGSVDDAFVDPDHDAALLHMVDGCLRPLTPFILNDQSPPTIGTALYDMGWGVVDAANMNVYGTLRIGTGSVIDKSGIGADEIALGGPNLLCLHDDGGPHFAYGSNGFPVAYAIFEHGDAGCSQYNVSVRVDALITFITSHVSNVCLRSNPTGPHCDGLLRNGFDAPLN